jgi:hypothetical protein
MVIKDNKNNKGLMIMFSNKFLCSIANQGGHYGGCTLTVFEDSIKIFHQFGYSEIIKKNDIESIKIKKGWIRKYFVIKYLYTYKNTIDENVIFVFRKRQFIKCVKSVLGIEIEVKNDEK